MLFRVVDHCNPDWHQIQQPLPSGAATAPLNNAIRPAAASDPKPERRLPITAEHKQADLNFVIAFVS